MNICLCGIQSGYQHKEYCPFPYYGKDIKKFDKWYKERNKIICKNNKSDTWLMETRCKVIDGECPKKLY